MHSDQPQRTRAYVLLLHEVASAVTESGQEQGPTPARKAKLIPANVVPWLPIQTFKAHILMSVLELRKQGSRVESWFVLAPDFPLEGRSHVVVSGLEKTALAV